MIKYVFVIEDGDYLYDSIHQRLVEFKKDGSVVIGNIPNTGVCVAFPISLNEDVLEAIGFKSNGNAQYVNGDYVINIDCTNPYSILQFEGKPVLFVSDIQNECRKKGYPLDIDKNSLIQSCNRSKTASN